MIYINIFEYIVIAVVLVIVMFAIIKATKKDASLDLNKLVEYLGGKDNIIKTESEMSRYSQKVKANIKAKIGAVDDRP